MAVNDIPEFVEVAPGDLIRSENWNNMQQQMRDSLRRHQHTRAPNATVNDAASTDEADQIGTNEIADGAITAQKLAPGALSADSLAAGSVGTSQLVDNAVTAAKLAPNTVTTGKLAFVPVGSSGSSALQPGQSVESLVKAGVPNTKTVIYFPVLSLSNTTGVGGAASQVVANVSYHQTVGSSTLDLYIRLTNNGNAATGVIWQVLTFAS